MPCEPEVHADEVVQMRPLQPKKTPMLTGAVCAIMRTYVVAVMPRQLLERMRCASSATALGWPAEDPKATPVAGEETTGSPRSPASSSASRAVFTAIRATRPIERVFLRGKISGSTSKGAAGAATRVLRSSSFSHSVMRRMPERFS